MNLENTGLKCGLEIHQQLDTGKLFCRCKPQLHEEKSHWLTHRYLQPVASEVGEFDRAAMEQFQRGESFVYHAFPKTNCLVDLDEEPPHAMDQDALATTIKVALMTNCHVFDSIYTMRKLVIDGSNVSGFQRTALLATNGQMDVNGKKIGILSIAVEEDSARPLKIANDRHEVHYNLDRLGTPLIELATDASIQTPEECFEVAKKIGEIMRLTGMARRGLGTIRQDVNISIAGGSRVEVKGCQNLELLPEVVRREIKRQQSLLEISKKLQERKNPAFSLGESFQLVEKDVTDLFSKTDSKLMKGKIIAGARVPGFSDIFGTSVQPDRRFGTEVSNYVKRLTGKGIVHSDELPNYGVTLEEVEAVRKRLDCQKEDAFVLTADPADKKILIFKTIQERCQIAMNGIIPEETRQCLEDGNSEYLRPLPGSARMYPETDIQPIIVTDQLMNTIRKSLPESVEKRFEKFTKKFGLSSQLAQKMVLANEAIWFEEMVNKGIDATTAAVLLLEGFTTLEREGVLVENLEKSQIEEALFEVMKKTIPKEALLLLMREWAKNPNQSFFDIKNHLKLDNVSESSVKEKVHQIAQQNANLIKEKGDRAFSAVMGDAMKEFRGKVSGEMLGKIVKEVLEEFK